MGDGATSRPLGILPAAPLTEAQLGSLRELERYDLSLVRQRLFEDGAMPAAWLDEALLEFRRYLSLRLLRTGSLIMFSDHVDHVWHTCILFTRLYADLCQRVFGEFVHHEPTMTDDPERPAKIAGLQSFYRELYGEMSYLWGSGQGRRCG